MRWVTRCTFSWNRRTSIQPANTHSGMLMMNSQRQVSHSENTPPRVGPTTAEIAHTLAR